MKLSKLLRVSLPQRADTSITGIARTVALVAALLNGATPALAKERSIDWVARGRQLVQTSGCNDCHTPAYPEKAGKVPEAQWLTGSDLGWRGAWGTTYPTNLRLMFQGMNEAQWLQHARRMEPRPPMPWFNLRAMSDNDLRAIYRYTRAAGAAGNRAPAYVPPGQEPAPPFVQFPQ